MLTTLQALFGILHEPVIAARGGEIIYRNTTAKSSPRFASRTLRELVPSVALDTGSEGFLTEADIGGESYMLSGSRLEDAFVYVFRRDRTPELAQTENVISSVSAALREPMSVLGIAAGQLLPFIETEGDEKLQEYAKMVYRAFYGMLRSLNRLDAFVFLSGGTPTAPERARVELVGLISDLVGTLTQMLDLPEGRLEFTTETRELPVLGDRRLLERMMLCLLGNAFIFTEAETNINISLRMKDDKAIISVADNGAGIPEDARFDVWTRYGSTRALDDTKSGSGFGLSVVQAISRAHGGGALLESRPGLGTTVVVSIATSPGDDIIPVFDAAEEYASVSNMGEIFAELVNIIPRDKFTTKYMD